MKAQLLGFGDALLDAAHRTNLTTQTYFASHTPASLDRRVHITAQYGGYHTEIHRQVCDTQSACYVQEHILLHQFEAYPLLEHSQEHVEPTLVEARSRALWCAIGCGRYKRLRLDQERTDTLDGTADCHSRQTVMIVGKQELRRIAHLSESTLLHLVDT